jgi:multimeric flavodoxin WrbA
MKKILAICGSPRAGNTEFLLRTILKHCKGAKTELILLRKLNIHHCGGCLVCDKTGKCHQNDDMQKLYPKLLAADVIIFGTPTYFNDVTGLMKDFLDRLNPLGVGRRLKGKHVFAVVTGAAEPQSAKRAVETLKIFSEIEKMNFKGALIFKAYKAGEAVRNKNVVLKCKKMAAQMVK